MPTVEGGRVRENHDVPDKIGGAAGLSQPDYIDLFSAMAPRASDHSPESWARVALEGASPLGRFIAWQVLCGLRLETRPSPDYVAGWKIAERGDDWIRLEASSWFMTVHAVVHVDDVHVSIALFIRYDNSMGGPVWQSLSVLHRRLMPGLLRGAVRRMNRTPR